MENVSLVNAEHHHSSRKSKVKRLTDNISSHSPVLHVPQMSESALKRWREARDAYLDGRYPHKKKHRQIKQKNKTTTTTKKEETKSFFTCEPHQFSVTDLSLEQQQQEVPQIIHDNVDDKCIGTETDVEQIDEATQADIPSPELELHPEYDINIIEDEKKEQRQSDQESIEYIDKATETDLILNINKEDEIEIDHQSIKETIIDSIPNVHQEIVLTNDDDDTKSILSSNESNTSASKKLLRYFFFFD
jgi:hypothetical protein